MKSKHFKSVIAGFMAVILSFMGFILPETKAQESNSLELIYKLDFNDSQDRGKNSASTEFASAEFVGTGYTYTDNDIKGNTSVFLSGGSVRTNYITIDGDVLNRDSITLAGWFKIPSDVSSLARLFELYGNNDNLISIMPYATTYNNGLHICSTIEGEIQYGVDNKDNIIYEGVDADKKTTANIPEASYVLPVYDTWVHYAYEFTPDALKIYQNGKLMKSLAGDFTASQFYTQDAKIVLGATLDSDLNDSDIKAGFADIRVYEGALTGDEITSEYDLTYKDFLTTSYDFENGTTDSIRDYDGTLTGKAEVTTLEGKGGVLNLVGTPSNTSGRVNRTSMQLPAKVLSGHNNITIMMDLYVASSTGTYARIFEFSHNGSITSAANNAIWTLGTRWGSSSNTTMRHAFSGVAASSSNFSMDMSNIFDKWVHLTVTVEGTTAKVFVDGVLLGESENFAYKNSIFSETTSLMYLGQSGYASDASLDGMMDNVKIYQTALTEREVRIEAGKTNEFVGRNLSLDGTIAFNFYVDSDNTLSDEAYVEFSVVNGETTTSIGTVSKTKAEEALYGLKFQCPLAAKQMADSIKATIYDGGEEKDTQTTSIKTYADYIITNKATYGDEIASLMQAMLNYGAYAQQHFNYNTGNLAADVSTVDLSKATAEVLATYNLTSEGGSEDFVLPKGASLVLESETTLKIFFQVGTNVQVEHLTFTVNEKTCTSAEDEETGYVVVEIPNISAKALDTSYTVVVTDGTNTLTTSCSALTYCYSTLVNSDTDETLKNVVKALYLYNDAANRYFEQ